MMLISSGSPPWHILQKKVSFPLFWPDKMLWIQRNWVQSFSDSETFEPILSKDINITGYWIPLFFLSPAIRRISENTLTIFGDFLRNFKVPKNYFFTKYSNRSGTNFLISSLSISTLRNIYVKSRNLPGQLSDPCWNPSDCLA